MLERKEILSLEFYKKSPFHGSYKGVRYRIEKEEDENACYPLVDNSGWTYEESGSLVEYIVENYSFKDFIKAFACEGRAEEENDEIIQKYIDEWRESLKD